MLEEIKERLSDAEYDKVGDMLLELLAQCPYVPKDASIKINSEDAKPCVSVWTTGGNYAKKYISGSFEAELWLEIGYKSFPKGNGQMIDAQAIVDNIAKWLENITELPKLSDGRKITSFTANNSVPTVNDVESDTSTTFAVRAAMKYFKKKGA